MRPTPLFFALLQIALAAKRADQICNDHCSNAYLKQQSCGGTDDVSSQSATLKCLCADESYWSELALCDCSSYDSNVSAQELRAYYCNVGVTGGSQGQSTSGDANAATNSNDATGTATDAAAATNGNDGASGTADANNANNTDGNGATNASNTNNNGSTDTAGSSGNLSLIHI